MIFFDAHNHLQDYEDSGRFAALAAAANAGVRGMLCCAARPGDWARVLTMAAAEKSVFPCLGVHPWFASELTADALARLEELLRGAPGCALGEIGLDGARPAAGQAEAFMAQLLLAGKLRRPVVIHCVRAWGRMLAAIRSSKISNFLLHAYGGSAQNAGDFAALGGYFSFGAEILLPARARARAALLSVPRSRLLFETDSPGPGRRAAGPAGIGQVVACAAAILGVAPGELAELSYNNGLEFTAQAGRGR